MRPYAIAAALGGTFSGLVVLWFLALGAQTNWTYAHTLLCIGGGAVAGLFALMFSVD